MPRPANSTYQHFLRYAGHIALALREFPNCIAIDPSPMSVETFAPGLRDAIHAGLKYGYKHPEIAQGDFATNAPLLAIGMRAADDNVPKPYVLIGERGVMRKKLTVNVKRVATEQQTSVEVHEAFLSEVCLLVQRRALSPMPQFCFKSEDPDILARFTSAYDITIVPDDQEKGKYFIL